MKSFVKKIQLILVLLGLAIIYSGCNKGPDIKIYSYPAPVPLDFTPKTGYPGIDVTITGSSFGTYANAVKVYFNGIKADTVRYCDDGKIVVKVPSNGISGTVTVQVWKSVVDLKGVYTYVAPPTIKSLSANAGAPGDIISIKGKGFGTDLTKLVLSFNGTNSTLNSVVNDTLITATVPANFTSGNLTLFVSGYSVPIGTFTYLTFVAAPVYQLDFEGNLNATIGSNATYNLGGGQPLTYVTGINGKAAYFAGYTSSGQGDNGQTISLPQNVAQYNELTISCWVQYDGTGPNANWGTPVFSIGHTRGNNISFNVSTGWPTMQNWISTGVVFENVTGFTGYSSYPISTQKTTVDTAWHHLVMTLSKSKLVENIYLDGVNIGTTALPAAYDLTVYTQDRAYLGAGCVSNTGEPALKGAIDKFQVYNSALTANQVYTLYYKK